MTLVYILFLSGFATLTWQRQRSERRQAYAAVRQR